MDATNAVTQAADRPRRRARMGLTTMLVGGMTLLILLAVGSVLWITLASATRNTFELLGQQAENTLDLLESRIDRQLGPAIDAGIGFGAQFADGRLNLEGKRNDAFHAFSGALSSNPHLTALIFVRHDGEAMTVTRQEGFPIEVRPDRMSLERQEFALQAAARAREPFWVQPLWVSSIRQAVLAHVTPVRRGDELHGTVVASLTLTGISEFLHRLRDEEGLNAFILYDGERVLAHSRLGESSFENPGTIEGSPLPMIDEFPEPSFHMLWGGGNEAGLLQEFTDGRVEARVDDTHIIITRGTSRFTSRERNSSDVHPWTFGVILEQVSAGREVVRLLNTAIAGGVIFLLAVVTGILFARHLNRQIRGLVTSASALTRLEAGNAPEVPDSRITELSEAAQAFNRMIRALRLFETYVPKPLVLGLIQRGETVRASEERRLTVMFTDIRGFSTLSEHMQAGEIARLLNGHFQMLADAIEAEGGTVDKYIGDAIMAFWGAPEHVPDHGARALRAAAEIQRRVRADNARRRADGSPPLHVRVGVHTGPVVVGNIGSTSRVNYTVVGDAVNTASRIDSLAKEIASDEDCIVLVSGDACAQAGDAEGAGYTLHPLGERDIRGREGTVSVFRLDAGDAPG